MWLNPQETADLVTFTGETLNGKLHFLCSDNCVHVRLFYNFINLCKWRTYIHKTILAYFLTDTLNWQMFWVKEEYLLNSSYGKLKNKISLKQM